MKRYPLMRVLADGLRPMLVLVGAALVSALVALGSFAFFGPIKGMVTFVVYVGFVPALFMTRVGKSSLGKVKAPWGSISVGADGLLVQTLAGTAFHSFADLSRVRAKGTDRVVLWLADGERVVLACADSDELERAIEQAWQRYQRAPGAYRAELERGRESFASYLDRVRALIGDGGFRRQPVDHREIVAVAVDPRAPAAQRVGAALALTDAPEPVRAKLRVAVEETVDPVLREALDRVLEGDASSLEAHAAGRRLRSLR